MRAQVIEALRTLTPEWTDFSAADPGVTLLELVCFVADHLSYYQDRLQNEGYLLTAQQRSAVEQMLSLIGYHMSPAAAASVGLEVVVTADPVVIPVGTLFTSSASDVTPALQFELLEQVTIAGTGAAPGHPVTVSADESGVVVYEGTSYANEDLGVSLGTANQRFTFSNAPVQLCADFDIEIYVGATKWTHAETDSFIDADSDSEVYVMSYDADGNATAIFGDGVSGKKPDKGSHIYATYRTGNGALGNSVGTDAIKKFSPAVAGLTSCTNTSQPSGGNSQESVGHAKLYGPLANRSHDRAVTLGDFESIALLTPGVSLISARACHGDTVNDVLLYVAVAGTNPVPSGKWIPKLSAGSGVIGKVGRYVADRAVIGTRLDVKPPLVIAPYFKATVYVLPNILRSTVTYGVRRALVDYFITVLTEFGITVPLSAVVAVIEGVFGVQKVVVEAYHRIPSSRFVFGNEAAFDASTTEVTEIAAGCVSQKYTLEWLGSGQFKLRGDTLGYMVDEDGVPILFSSGVATTVYHYNTGDTLAAVVEQFTLEVTVPTPPNVGDRWEFSVDNYIDLDGIKAGSHEIVVATISGKDQLSGSEFSLSYSGGISGS